MPEQLSPLEDALDNVGEEIRRVASIMAIESETSYAKAIAEKILHVVTPDEDDDYWYTYQDDVKIYRKDKKLGIFSVHEATASFDYKAPEVGFSLHKGDSYLDLHLPQVAQGLRSRKAVNDSLRLIQDYVVSHDLHPKYVMGVTYPKLARIARQYFGFGTVQVNLDSLPEGLVQDIQSACKGLNTDFEIEDIGRIAVIVFHSGPN